MYLDFQQEAHALKLITEAATLDNVAPTPETLALTYGIACGQSYDHVLAQNENYKHVAENYLNFPSNILNHNYSNIGRINRRLKKLLAKESIPNESVYRCAVESFTKLLTLEDMVLEDTQENAMIIISFSSGWIKQKELAPERMKSVRYIAPIGPVIN